MTFMPTPVEYPSALKANFPIHPTMCDHVLYYTSTHL